MEQNYQQPLWQYMGTNLPIGEEAQFQIDKYYSPFRNDSGYDYDYRGYWKDRGHLYPNISTTNNHLGDEYKYPIHPTFSVESNYYTGQPYAVDWNAPLWQKLGEMGLY